MLDKFGKCPTCGCNWNGGDIKEHISKMQVFHSRTEGELMQIAASYGWTPQNPIRFTKLVNVNRGPNKMYWRCPSCRDTYDQITGEKVSFKKLIQEERERLALLSEIEGKIFDL
jgi:hypothetical protein